MKSIYILFALVAFIEFSCNSSKLAINNSHEAELTSSNDTIFFHNLPVAKVEHYGWVIDNNDNYTQKIVLKDISCCDDYSQDVISYVKHKHHEALIEYRNK
jgi:hypothetical protein